MTSRVLTVLQFCTDLRWEVETAATDGLYHQSTLKQVAMWLGMSSLNGLQLQQCHPIGQLQDMAWNHSLKVPYQSKIREALWSCRDFYSATAVGALNTARRVCYGGGYTPLRRQPPSLFVGNEQFSPQILVSYGIPLHLHFGNRCPYFHSHVYSLVDENGFA